MNKSEIIMNSIKLIMIIVLLLIAGLIFSLIISPQTKEMPEMDCNKIEKALITNTFPYQGVAHNNLLWIKKYDVPFYLSQSDMREYYGKNCFKEENKRK